jgi:hypothetical protein
MRNGFSPYNLLRLAHFFFMMQVKNLTSTLDNTSTVERMPALDEVKIHDEEKNFVVFYGMMAYNMYIEMILLH